MLRGLLVVLGCVLLFASDANAEAVWTLRTGPTSVESIPLEPVQLVSAWRAQYSDGIDTVWLYATRSLQFFAPKAANVVAVAPTPWTIVVFYPEAWTSAARTAWLTPWLADFRTLATLPDPGFPIVFPAVLRKG